MAAQIPNPDVRLDGGTEPAVQIVRTILRKLAELLLLMLGVHALYFLLAGADAVWPAVLAGGVSLFFILPDHGWFGFLGLSVAIAAASETSQAWFELQALQAAPLSAPISAAQAPQFPKTGRFLFSDGELKMPLSYTGHVVARHRGRTRDCGIQVVPLVPASWKPTQPVPAWGVTLWTVHEPESDQSEPNQPCPEAARLLELDWPASEARTILRQAVARHHLISARGAPLLICQAEPLAQARFRLQRGLAFSGQSIAALFAAFLLWLCGRALWKRRQSA